MRSPGTFALVATILTAGCHHGSTSGPSTAASPATTADGTGADTGSGTGSSPTPAAVHAAPGFAIAGAPTANPGHGYDVTWSALAGATGYVLVVALNADCLNPQTTLPAQTATTARVPAPADGAYYLCLTATTPAGAVPAQNSPYPWQATTAAPSPFTLSPPYAESSTTSPTVAWTSAAAPTTNGTTEPAGAIVYSVTLRKLTQYPATFDAASKQVLPAGADTSLTLPVLTNGVFAYDVQAINAASATVTATTPASGPGLMLVATAPVGTWTPRPIPPLTPRSDAIVVWTGATTNQVIVWGGETDKAALGTGGVLDLASGTWTATATTKAPAAGTGPGLWTGSKLLVWGGSDFDLGTFQATTVYGAGGQYDPAANTWTATSTTGAPAARWGHTIVLDPVHGKAIVWGGLGTAAVDGSAAPLATGGLYDPAADQWTSLGTTGSPAARARHTAIWTGTRMLVWGGFSAGPGPLGDGGLATGDAYDPVANGWTPLATDGAPSARYGHTAVWTGTRMLIWGGMGDGAQATGGIYDPGANAWLPMEASYAPFPRIRHAGVWTGNRLVVFAGGDGAGDFFGFGGEYDPAANTWSHTTTTGAPVRRWGMGAVMTGTQVLLYGGDTFYPGGPAGSLFGTAFLFTP